MGGGGSSLVPGADAAEGKVPFLVSCFLQSPPKPASPRPHPASPRASHSPEWPAATTLSLSLSPSLEDAHFIQSHSGSPSRGWYSSSIPPFGGKQKKGKVTFSMFPPFLPSLPLFFPHSSLAPCPNLTLSVGIELFVQSPLID